jgi:hypothetical protein
MDESELVLKKITKSLAKTYHVDPFMDNAIAISFDEGESHFALVIIEENESVCYSVAADAPDPFSVCEVLLRLINICKIELAEPFYVNDSGDVLWGEDAYKAVGVSSSSGNKLDDMESPSKLVN